MPVFKFQPFQLLTATTLSQLFLFIYLFIFLSCLNSSPAKPQQRISSSLPAHSGVKQDWEGKGKKIKESELILLSNLLGGKVIRMFLHLGKFSNLQINYETQITWVSLPPSHPTLPVIPIIYSAARVTILVAEI